MRKRIRKSIAFFVALLLFTSVFFTEGGLAMCNAETINVRQEEVNSNDEPEESVIGGSTDGMTDDEPKEPANYNSDNSNVVILPVEFRTRLFSKSSLLCDTVAASVYAPLNTTEVTINKILLHDEIPSTARIQAVDDDGSVVATTNGLDLNIYEDYESGNYYIDYETLYLLKSLSVGNYNMQAVYGDAANPTTVAVESTLTVVVDPIITYGYIRGLTEGISDFGVDISVANFTGEPEDFSLELLDEDGEVIATDAVAFFINAQDDGIVNLKYYLTPNVEIISGSSYFLKIIYDGDNLYNTAGGISTTAQSAEKIAISSISIDDTVIGGIIVEADNVLSSSEYYVEVMMDSSYNGSTLYRGKLSPDNDGVFYITLTKNGIQLPLYVYTQEYHSRGIYVKITDLSDDSNFVTEYYNISGSYNFYQSASLSLEAADTENQYLFLLEGRNILLDIYEGTTSSIVLKKFVSGEGYVEIGDLQGTVQKSSYQSGDNIYYTFNGMLSTEEPLTNGIYYALYVNDEHLAGTSRIAAETGVDELAVYQCYIPNYDYDTNTFYFNFEALKVEATLEGGSGSAKVQLITKDDDTVISESILTDGILNSYGQHEYEFVLPYSDALSPSIAYTLQFIDDNETAHLSESQIYYEFYYDDNIVLDEYWYIEKDLFAGDEEITLRVSGKNLTSDYISSNKPFDIVRMATNEAFDYSVSTVEDTGYYCYITLALSDEIPFGTYEYQSCNNIYVREKAPSIGDCIEVEYGDGSYKVVISNCRELSKGNTYSAILFDIYENGYGILNEDITLILKDDGNLLVENLPQNMENGSYTLAVWEDNIFIGTTSFYVSWGNDTDTDMPDPLILGYEKIYNEEEGYYSYSEISYLTSNREVAFQTYKAGYAYVRFSEDKSTLTDLAYSPVRDHPNQELTLSQGSGQKTVYVQFRKTEGMESPVYTWICELKESGEVYEIVSAELSTGYIVPEETEFSISTVTTSRLCDVYADAIVGEGDSAHSYKKYALEYVEQTDAGYLFRLTLNSGDWPYSDSAYGFTAFECYIMDLDGQTELDRVEVPARFSPLNNILLSSWDLYGGTVYTNEQNYSIVGYASSNTNVTINYIQDDNESNSGSAETTSDAYGRFSVVLPYLTEGRYIITASDGVLSTIPIDYYLIYDITPLVLTYLEAVLIDSNNVAISWETNDTDLAYYLLWKNNVPILTTSNNYTATSYIDTGNIASTYRVAAVDHAGNQSAALEKTVGDEQPPTTPGPPTLTACGTKTVSFDWAASADNIAVVEYDVFRDDVKIASTEINSFTDTGLVEGTVYTYYVAARDRAGNVSVPSDSEQLSTATLTISSHTMFDETYIKEEYPELPLMLRIADIDKYDINSCDVVLNYRIKGTADWNEISLSNFSSGLYTADWSIKSVNSATYEVRFSVEDGDGTVKTTHVQETIIKSDDIAPEISISTPSEGNTHSGTELSINGTTTDNVEVDKVIIAYSNDGSSFTDIQTINNEEVSGRDYFFWSYVWDASDLNSGEITLRVTAYDGVGNTSTAARQFTLDNTAPAVPTDMTISSTDVYIHLQWSHSPVEEDFSHFNIYRSVNTDDGFVLVEQIDTLGYYDDGTPGINGVPGIVANTRYYYYITSVDDANNESNPSTIVSGIVERDEESPRVVSYLPQEDTQLCHTASLNVSAVDNFKLSSLTIDYKAAENENWIALTEIAADADTKSQVFNYQWDISSLPAGSYQVRYTVKDSNELKSMPTIVNYTIAAYTLPVPPVLEAANRHRSVELTWQYSGNTDLVKNYIIFRTIEDSDEYTQIGSTSDKKYTDTSGILDQTYSYYIEVIDKYDGTAQSNYATGKPVLDDKEDPVAVVALQNITAAVGESIAFDGSGSTDNDIIVHYSWDFGDGTSDTGVRTSHSFTEVGIYTAELTVTDESGNANSTTVIIKVVQTGSGFPDENGTVYQLATIEVVSSKSGESIADTEVLIRNSDNKTETICTTDSSGEVCLALPKGNYTVTATKSGYTAATSQIVVTDSENPSFTVVLRSVDIVVGSLTATEMTLDEIIEAGIDIDDPDNQHVYRFAVVLEFNDDKQSNFELPFTFYRNSTGKILGDGCFVGDFDGFGGFGGMRFNVYPISERFFLVIYGEAHWLKEMFNVELVVANTSAVEWLEDCTATLELPEGLSLAAMKTDNQQSETIELERIDPGKSATGRWFIRGDKEGEYNLSAAVRGKYMPNGDSFAMNFTTSKPLTVWAGSALNLNIIAHNTAKVGKQYQVEFELVNVSNKELSNLSFAITGCKQYRVTTTQDGKEVEVMSSESLNKVIEVETLAPGESLKYNFSTLIMFDDFNKNYLYYLKNWFVTTMEGSTTEIPVNFIIIDDTLFGSLSIDTSKQGSLTFTVVDEETLQPVQGMYVFSDYLGPAKITDDNGQVEFTSVNYTNGSYIVAVSYEENSLPIRTLKFVIANKDMEYKIYVPSSSDPYITNMTITNPSGKARDYNYLTTAKYCIESKNTKDYYIELGINWQGRSPKGVSMIGRSSGETITVSREDDDTKGIVRAALGSVFEKGETIKFVLTDADNNKYEYDCPIIVVDNQIAYIVDYALSMVNIPYVETEATNLLYEGIQLLGGSKFKVDLTELKLNQVQNCTVTLEDDAIKVEIGLNALGSHGESYVIDGRFLGDNKVSVEGGFWFKVPYNEFGIEGLEGGIFVQLKYKKVPFTTHDEDKCIIFYKDLYFNMPTPIGAIPLVGTVEVGTKFKTTFTVGYNAIDHDVYIKGKASPAVSVKGAAGPGVKGNNIQLGIEGTGTLNINFTESKDLSEFLDAELEVWLILQGELFNVIEWDKDLIKLLKWPDEEEENLDDLKARIKSEQLSTDWSGSSSLRKMRLAAQSLQNTTTLVSNILTTTRSVIENVDGGKMMVLGMQQESRTPANKLRLVYSMENGIGWEQPQYVESEDDGTLDGDFSFASSSESAFLVYQNMKETFEAGYGETGVGVTDFLSGFEISVARYDYATNQWLASQALTDDSYADFIPQVAVSGNKAVAAWVANTDSDMLMKNGITSIRYAVFDGAAWSVVKSIPNIGSVLNLSVSYDGANAVIAYSKMSDTNEYTVYCMTLPDSGAAGAECVLSQGSKPSHSVVTFQHDGTTQYAWISDDGISVLNENGDLQIIESEPLINSLCVAVNGMDATIMWKEMIIIDEVKYKALYGSSFYAPRDVWCAGVELIAGEYSVENFDAALESDGKLTISYIEKALDTVVGETVEHGAANLKVAYVNRGCDLAIAKDTFIYSDAGYANGNEFAIQFSYGVSGLLPVEGASVKVYEGSNSSGRLLSEKTITTIMYPMDIYTFTDIIDVDEGVSSLYIVIQSINAEDDDNDNNTLVVTLGSVDLTISDGYFEYAPDAYNLYVNVANQGSAAAEDITVSIRDGSLDGEILYSEHIDTLKSMEYEVVHHKLSKSDVEFNRNANVYYVEVLSDAEDVNEVNNSTAYYLLKPDDVEITVPAITLNIVNLTIAVPAGGKTPQVEAAIPDGSHYQNTDNIVWYPADNTFGYGKVYTATITIAPDESYQFSPDVTVKINGVIVKNFVIGSNGVIIITHKFPATAPMSSGNPSSNKPSSGGSTGGVPAGKTSSEPPTIENNDGGTVTINEDGSINITAKEGYEIEKILVNGKPLDDASKLIGLTSKDIVKVIFKWKNPFHDVEESHWFYSAVEYAVGTDLLKGISSTEFAPNINMSRAMLITALYRLEGEPEVIAKNVFTDVQNNAWYTDAVIWATSNNIIHGYGDNLFGTNDSVTREQVATILYRYADYKGCDTSDRSDLSKYGDADKISPWAKDAIVWANAAGIITGRKGNILAPDETITRAEVATILMRFNK